jgi:hypothetical protein
MILESVPAGMILEVSSWDGPGWSRMVIWTDPGSWVSMILGIDDPGRVPRSDIPDFHTQGHEIPGSQLEDPDRDIPIMTKRTTLANPRLNSS